MLTFQRLKHVGWRNWQVIIDFAVCWIKYYIISLLNGICFFLNSFIAQTVYTVCNRINYKIVCVTNFSKYVHYGGIAVAQWVRCCAANRKIAGSIPAGVSGIFYWHKIFPIALWPWGDSFSNRNEYQEYFLGGKGGRCVRLTTLPPSCAVVTKSGNLNFPETSGPLQACNGTDLPLPFIYTMVQYKWNWIICI